MAFWSWCLISAAIFGPAAIFAQDDFNFQLPKELQEFSLPLPGAPGSVAVVNQSTSLGGQANDTSANEQPEEQADQPMEEVPTRPPSDPGKASTFPPLVHGNGTANGTKTEETTAQPMETTTPKKDASAAFYANSLLVLGGACVLHLFY